MDSWVRASNPGSGPQGEPMGNVIRRLVNDTSGANLPMQEYRAHAPRGPFATLDDSIAFEKRKWRETEPTALYFKPGMSFDGITKLRTPEEYEAFKDDAAARTAHQLYALENNRILPGSHWGGWRKY